mgnify:FL=1
MKTTFKAMLLGTVAAAVLVGAAVAQDKRVLK